MIVIVIVIVLSEVTDCNMVVETRHLTTETDNSAEFFVQCSYSSSLLQVTQLFVSVSFRICLCFDFDHEYSCVIRVCCQSLKSLLYSPIMNIHILDAYNHLCCIH